MSRDILEALRRCMDEKYILRDEPMSSHTSFKVGGPAKLYLIPDVSELRLAVAALRENGYPFMVIGNGSNLLVGDKGIDGAVIEIGRRISGVSIAGCRVRSGAGALLSSISKKILAAELSGFEFASGIPGSAGGGVFMNAGAYGGEIRDILKGVTVIDSDGDIRDLPADELDLKYRSSNIESRGYIVTETVFELRRGEHDQILSLMNDLKERRRQKQPLEYPSGGSTFKRPEGYFAGRLIQEANLAGFSCGDAQISQKHCGFVINRGRASAAEIRELIEETVRIVKERTGVGLEPEIRFVGNF